MPRNRSPVRIIWTHDPEAPLAAYSTPPDEITLNAVLWPQTPAHERRRALAHEFGHHDTGAIFPWFDDPERQVDLACVEAKAQRAGLLRLIPEAQVRAAILDGCETLADFAAFWQVDPATARARLALYNNGLW